MFLNKFALSASKRKTILSAVLSIIFYDVKSFHSVAVGDVTFKTPKTRSLLKIKVSDEKKW